MDNFFFSWCMFSSHVGSSGSGSAESGVQRSGDWSNRLTWYPNAKYLDNTHAYNFAEDEESLFFKKCLYDLDQVPIKLDVLLQQQRKIFSQESVKKVYFFKTPLGPQHFRTFAMVKNVTGMKGLGRIICV